MEQCNTLFVILLICAIVKMKYGFDEGLSKGLYRLVVTIVSLIVIFEIVIGIKGALEHQTIMTVRAVISLLIILVVYKIVNLPLTSLKLLSKTPGIHMIDKILGAVLGILECVLIVWIAFLATDYVKYEPIYQWIMEQTNTNHVISLLYNKNYVKEVVTYLLLLG